MSTYMIEHLKSNPGHAPGKVIKAGTKVADAGLTGKLSASGHLMHICKASESGKKIKDFNRGSNTGYANATMQDPNDIRSKFNKEVYGTWGGDNSGYAQSDGDFYVAPKVHLGGDFKFEDGSTAIIFKSDIKIIECGSESSNPDFGNCISFEFVSSSSSTPPSSTPKTVKGYSFNECSSNNGSSFFDIENYGSTEDDLCFSIGNLKKLSSGAYDLTKAQHGYSVHTQFKGIKTTFYTDGTKSTGSSSSSSRYKLTQYYYNGWHKDTTIPFYNDDKDLSNLGNGEYKLKVDKSGWKKDTRFKK